MYLPISNNMTEFSWNPEISDVEINGDYIRSTSRSEHNFSFEEVSADNNDKYRVLDIGCGGAAYMKDITKKLNNADIEDIQVVGLDANDEVIRTSAISNYEKALNRFGKTMEKSWNSLQERDLFDTVYNTSKGIYDSINTLFEESVETNECVELAVGDGQEIPFQDDSFDLVVSQYLLGYDDIIDDDQIREEAERVAKPDGDVWFYIDEV